VHTYPISKEAKEAELNVIKNILQNNEYNVNITEKPHQGKKITQTPRTKTLNGPHLHTVEKKKNHKTFS
jgi:hypothetical protein